MTPQERDKGRTVEERLSGVAAPAALAVPGVAFLRPGLAGLLRGSVPSVLRRDSEGRPHGTGVRVERRTPDGADGTPGAGGVWTISVHVVLRRNRRAVDVARAVRVAVAEAVVGSGLTDAVAPEVGVTVTGFV